MNAIVGWLIYAIGAFVASVAVMRFVGASVPRCQGEGKDYRWGYGQQNCRRFDPATCWRVSGSVDRVALTWGFLGLIWPLAVLPALAYWTATRKPLPTATHDPTLDRRIADLERELGMLR